MLPVQEVFRDDMFVDIAWNLHVFHGRVTYGNCTDHMGGVKFTVQSATGNGVVGE